jgi:hypothetical protein
MNATAPAFPVPIVPDFLHSVENRLLRELQAAVHDWSGCLSRLSEWEDEHVLDNPTPEVQARHKSTVERLLRFGSFLVLATSQPHFPDRQLTEIVAATQRDLQDRLALWHGARPPREESERILAACFPE